ncbi:hypothetical protein [Pseudobacter ginsenosidimutans]|uniref:hypothetical protein n=1 Tax=Pseudobacter ginsenosidimutans TaxID=661488 RepID=UPI00102DC30C|nr:hypothetical protein [Pseudobacter ginsenosidimutans]QEC41578.1 hypothetical protein FSB84_07660 [Pseudobacter ginsenosidimutans]
MKTAYQYYGKGQFHENDKLCYGRPPRKIGANPDFFHTLSIEKGLQLVKAIPGKGDFTDDFFILRGMLVAFPAFIKKIDQELLAVSIVRILCDQWVFYFPITIVLASVN